MSSGHPVTCRFCRGTDGEVVLDLGAQPACDHFPAVDLPVEEDPRHPLRLWLCARCGLAQLAEDPTTPEEPRATEPEALMRQARDAIDRVAAAGLLPAAGTVREFGSPHGDSWLGLLADRGLVAPAPGQRADVVLDCLGLLHDRDQAEALELRLDALAPGGTLLVQFHSLAAVLGGSQWNAVRHGHFAYHSVTALTGMLAHRDVEVTHAFRFDLYGGTVLLAARRAGGAGPRDTAPLSELLREDDRLGITDPRRLRALDRSVGVLADQLHAHLEGAQREGRRVLAYGAASRAVSLLCRAGIAPDLLPAVADASPAKHGRRMPGSGVPIVPLERVRAAGPDEVLVFVPDLVDDARTAWPEVEAEGGCWMVVDPGLRPVRVGPRA
jgi:hypothetical protein